MEYRTDRGLETEIIDCTIIAVVLLSSYRGDQLYSLWDPSRYRDDRWDLL